MSERRRSSRPYRKILLILLFVVFPVLFIAVYVRPSSPIKYESDHQYHSDDYWDNDDHGPVIGIDLRDSHTRMAYIRLHKTEREPNGQMKRFVEILTDSDGRRDIPTFPDCTYDHCITEEASTCFTPPYAEIFSRNPEEYECILAEPLDTTGLPYKKVAPSCLNVKDGLTAGLENATAYVLRRMKAIATAHLGQEVKQAVVAVPAYLNIEQMVAIKDGGTAAGLQILRFIKAPIAAAIAHNLNEGPHYDDELNVVIFDLGSRGIDATVAVIEEGVFEILSAKHQESLGSQWIYNHVANSITRKWEAEHHMELLTNSAFMNAVENKVERAITGLSENFLKIAEDIEVFPDFHATLTRAEIEESIKPTFSASWNVFEDIMTESKLKTSDIDRLLLIGDSTRIPGMQGWLETLFGKKAMEKGDVDPDLAVAIGAATQATFESTVIQPVGCMVDVSDTMLGVEVAGGGVVRVIHEGTTIPLNKARNFTTVYDGQTRIDLKIYEERPNEQAQALLWTLSLEVPPALRGTPHIQVTFTIDRHHRLVVKALHVESGKVELFERLSNGLIATTSSPNQTDVQGGEIAVANVGHVSGGHEEL